MQVMDDDSIKKLILLLEQTIAVLLLGGEVIKYASRDTSCEVSCVPGYGGHHGRACRLL